MEEMVSWAEGTGVQQPRVGSPPLPSTLYHSIPLIFLAVSCTLETTDLFIVLQFMLCLAGSVRAEISLLHPLCLELSLV